MLLPRASAWVLCRVYSLEGKVDPLDDDDGDMIHGGWTAPIDDDDASIRHNTLFMPGGWQHQSVQEDDDTVSTIL